MSEGKKTIILGLVALGAMILAGILQSVYGLRSDVTELRRNWCVTDPALEHCVD